MAARPDRYHGDRSTAAGATATGPTASGEFDGPVSVDLSEAGGAAAGIEAELYSCDGVEGTWTYTVRGGPLDFDIDSTVDMDGGDGTLVISGDIALGGVSASFTDTVDLVVAGTPTPPRSRRPRSRLRWTATSPA